MLSLAVAMTTLVASTARATEPGLVVHLSLTNQADTFAYDTRHSLKLAREANADRGIIDVSEDRGPFEPGSPEWHQRTRALRDQLRSRLEGQPGRAVDLVVMHLSGEDFKFALEDADGKFPWPMVHPLRGRLSRNARVIILGPSPVANVADGKRLLNYLEAPAATLVLSTSKIQFGPALRAVVQRLPILAVAAATFGLGAIGYTQVPDFATNGAVFGVVPATFALGYVLNQVRRIVRDRSFTWVAPRSTGPGDYVGVVLGRDSLFGLFTMTDLMTAGGLLGLGAALVARGPGVFDGKFLEYGALAGAYIFVTTAGLPVWDAVITRILQRRGLINRGEINRFAPDTDEVVMRDRLDLADPRTYRCEEELTAAPAA